MTAATCRLQKLAVAVLSTLLILMLVLALPAGAARDPRDSIAPTAPTGVAVSAATTSTVSLGWQPSSDNVRVVSYLTTIGLDPVAASKKTNVTVTALRCGTSYWTGVQAVDHAGNRSPRALVTVTTSPCPDLQAPTPPSGVTQLVTTGSSVVLGWTASTDNVGVVGYGLYTGDLRVASSAEPTVTLTGLSCGLTYAYELDAVDAAGNRSETVPLLVRTSACGDGQAPTAPTGLSVTSQTASGLVLAWRASTDNVGVTGYRVRVNGSPAGTTSALSYSVDGLSCATPYTVSVDAFDASGNRSTAASLSTTTSPCPERASTDSTPPSSPGGLVVSSATRTGVSLGWQPSTDNVGVSGYGVYRGAQLLSTTSTTGATVAGLSCGTSQTVGVDAYDAAGNRSARSEVVATTSPCADTQPPTVPANVVASSRTATSIALTWSASTDNVGVVEYGAYRGGSRVASTPETTVVFSGLTCATNYTLGVDARDGAGNRSAQAVVLVATMPCPDTQAPSAPTGLRVAAVALTSIALAWGASSDNVGVSGYGVSVGGAQVTDTSATTATVPNLTCGTNYSFSVYAFDAAGNRSTPASISGATSACPSLPPPPPPTCTGPITISAGGTYTGCWTSTSSAPAIKITTTAPVVIADSTVTNIHGGALIETSFPLASDVTIRRVKGFGSSGRFFEAEGFKSIRIENSTIDKSSGIKLVHGAPGSSVVITRNKHRNIQTGNGNFGNFVQLGEVQESSIDVSWNEVVNEYNQSHPEDLVSIFKSAHARIHDNYFQGQFAPNNLGPSSQNPITLEVGDGSGPSTYDNHIYNNQIVDAVGGISMTSGTRDNVAHHNRVVQDGKLPDGMTSIGVGWLGLSIQSGSTNNQMHDNVVGFVNNYGDRNDMNFAGAPSGDSAERARNTSLPDPVTRSTETGEWDLWQQKLAANGVQVGTG
jgi:chitodextrinase